MRRFAKILSWLALLAAVATVLGLWVGVSPFAVPAAPTTGDNEHKTGAAPAGAAFAGFPLDQPRVIDFDLDELTMGQLNAREQLDQKRDWLLMTVAADSGASAETLSRSLYDLAPVRHGYMHQVANFDYGTTRFCCLSGAADGVIALVPRSDDPATRSDGLAHIFDEVRKNLGAEPARLQVFEYTLDGPAQATVTRRADIPGRRFIDPASGYHEASVASTAELGAFLGSVDDLVYAELEPDGRLRLGGRKLAAAKYRNITLEDVAAIWQAEKQIQTRMAELKAKWNKRFDELNARWRSTPTTIFSKMQAEQEGNALQAQYEEEAHRLHVVSGSGFSLDPSYDYAGLADVLAAGKYSRLLAALDDKPKDEPKPKKNAPRTAVEKDVDLSEVLTKSGVTRFEMDEAIRALRGERVNPVVSFETMLLPKGTPPAPPKPDAVPFLRIVDNLRQRAESDPDNIGAYFLNGLFEELLLKYRFQAARYDGPLNGTEVGMTLFYTDLLAKLWADDYVHSAPSDPVPGFAPQTRNIMPTVYRKELQKLPATRLWFGPEDRGYQIVGRSSLRFARSATRIYAASSNDLAPGKEVAANAPSEAFLGWWNDHYEEVAGYEPQYQRLNEIMKWSLLVGWLNNGSEGDRLAALADVPVEHGNWFPDWARRNPQLRFHDWESVRFFERNHLGSETEAMPILVSYHFNQFADEDKARPAWRLEGGVSLASKDLFHARAALSEELPALLRRSDLDYSHALGGADELVNLRGTRYHFEGLEDSLREISSVPVGRDIAALDMAAKDGLKFRARYGELRQGKFERVVARGSEGTMRLEASTASGEIGRLQVAPSKNGFRVGWRAREVEDGYALGRRLSASEDFGRTLAGESSVEFAVADTEKGEYYVKTYGTDRKWIKFARETTPTPDVAAGWDGRVADLAQKAEPVNIAWVDESKVPRQVMEGGRWVRGPPRARAPKPTISETSLEETVQRIASDPAAYKKELDAQFAGSLGDIDHLLDSGQGRRALAAIEGDLGRFGDNEHLRLRQALAELADRRPAAAAEALDAVRLDPARERAEALALLDEVNARLRAGSGDAGLLPMAESLDWRTCPLKPPGDTVRLVADDAGRFSHELRTGSFPEAGAAVDPHAVPDGSLVYFQDDPRLNNLDWNGSVKGSLDQLAGHGLGRVVELPRADLAHFAPSSIQTPAAKFSRAANTAPRYRPAPVNGYRAWSGTADNDDDDRDESGRPRRRRVFVVLAK